MEGGEQAIEIMKQLRALGFNLSIDDFGTGYSSLAYLKNYPIDELKIDRSFLKDAESDAQDSAIVSAIVNLAHSLGLRVVAEGVETEGQLGLLRGNGCNLYQGFWYSKPVPAEDFVAMLVDGR